MMLKFLRNFPWLESDEGTQVSFMIIGIQKAGTSWLASTLNQLDEVTRATPKETRFFNARWKKEYEKLGVSKLKRRYIDAHWPETPEGSMRFDASPGYLSSPVAPKRILRCYPKLKSVVLLREPASRMYSLYNMYCLEREGMGSFQDYYRPALDVAERVSKKYGDGMDFYRALMRENRDYSISNGMYFHHLTCWFQYFKRDRFFIMTTKQLRSPEVMGNLLEFLGLDRKLCERMDLDAEYKYRHRGEQAVPAHLDEIAKFYEPYNQKLYQLLGVSHLDW